MSAQKKEYLARKTAEAKARTTVFEIAPALLPSPRQNTGAITDIDATDVTVDFGGAPIEAFLDLMTILNRNGIENIRVGS